MKRTVQIEDIGKILTGSTPSTSDAENYNSDDISFVKPSDIGDFGITKLTTTEYYISNHARKKARIAPKGSVLVACIGIIGKTAILEKECAFNQQINAIIPDETLVLPQYLAYAIYAKKRFMQAKANAAVVPIINKTDFGKIQIVLHDISAQKAILTILERLDFSINHSNTILAKLDTLVKSRFVEMFGDPVTNPMGWEEHRLDEYITFLTSGSRGWSKYFSDDGEIFITIKNVKNNRITLENVQHVKPPDNSEAQRTKVREGDLLISITADLGRTGVVSKEIEERGAYINQHLTCIRMKQEEINPGYVSFFMESDAGKRQFKAKNQAAVKAGLNFDAIKSLKLLVPPLDLQNDFMSFVEQVDKSKAVLQKLLEKQELLRSALMQEYFG